MCSYAAANANSACSLASNSLAALIAMAVPPPLKGATLCHRAEVFRSKLIDDFQILESTSEQGKRIAPRYSTVDIIGKYIL